MNFERLNILIVTIAFPSQQNSLNGTFVKDMAKCIAKLHNVTVLHCTTIPKSSKITSEISEEIQDDLRVVNIFLKEGFFPTTLLTTRGILKGLNYLKKKQIPIDLIHAHFFASAIPFLWKMRKTPVVLTEHWSGFPLKKLGALNLVAKLVMSHCKMICPVSNYLMKSIMGYGIKSNFKVIYNPVDQNYFFLKQKNSGGIIKPLVIARQDPIKGIPTLLKAIALVSKIRADFHLDIVGHGPQYENYMHLSKQLKINNFVTFHGAKERTEVAKFMQSCDFLINSSISENQAVTLNEAICCGKPILATKVGGNVESVNENIGILVEPRNVEALKNGIITMLDNFKNYDFSEIALSGKQSYGYESIGKKYDQVYKHVLNL